MSCRNINVSYDTTPLFQNFSLNFPPGKCTCLLGASGCGKSTLIRIISGTKAIAHTGEVRFHGNSGSGQAVAWMSQKDLLLPWLTVIDNILLGANLRGQVDEILRSNALQMLRDAGMEKYGDKYPAVLSGGMRQRVALLRTLMEERQVILMDEPFSALDALTRLKLQDLSATLTRGKTVIMVTHDPMEALRLGDRIIVLGGSPATIVADMTPEGPVPRKTDSGILTEEYPRLLKTLMNGATT
ncbi:ABC transporter ATP-binding protein [Desulforhopalus sp. 52FAK]